MVSDSNWVIMGKDREHRGRSVIGMIIIIIITIITIAFKGAL